MRWKMKAKAGRHVMSGGKVVLPGQIIDCTRDEIGHALDKFEQLDPDPPEPTTPIRAKLIVVERHDGGFDVVNEKTRRRLNSRKLTKEDAEDIVKSAQPVPSVTMDPEREAKGTKVEMETIGETDPDAEAGPLPLYVTNANRED
jgi:hypothetical protein